MEELKDTLIDNDIIEEIEENTEQEDFSTSEYNNQGDYKVKGIEEFVDLDKGEVVDTNSLSPWEKIQHLAKQLNVELKEPKEDCKRCYGRGYESIEHKTNIPIPCSCIFKDKVNPLDVSQNTIASSNRRARKNMDRYIALQRRQLLKKQDEMFKKKVETKAAQKSKNRKKMAEKTRKINRSKKK